MLDLNFKGDWAHTLCSMFQASKELPASFRYLGLHLQQANALIQVKQHATCIAQAGRVLKLLLAHISRAHVLHAGLPPHPPRSQPSDVHHAAMPAGLSAQQGLARRGRWCTWYPGMRRSTCVRHMDFRLWQARAGPFTHSLNVTCFTT